MSWSKSLVLLVLPAAGAMAQEHAAPVRLVLGDAALELRAAWEPVTDTVYKFDQRPLIQNLRPAAERMQHGAERFRPLLPTDPVAVGDTWRIDVEQVLPLLRQFHAGATAELHHDGGMGLGALGGWGCLRALGATHAEVAFRVHAEFLLEGDGRRGGSSWFTPAQFRGRLLLDRQRNELVGFELGVPAQSANVDINLAEGDGVVCDIGRIPCMDLRGGEFPTWTPATAIPEREAADRLARRFYPLAEIDWLELPAARAESVRTGKPLHVIALFGSLADESC